MRERASRSLHRHVVTRWPTPRVIEADNAVDAKFKGNQGGIARGNASGLPNQRCLGYGSRTQWLRAGKDGRGDQDQQ